jgi:peroxiredoxin
VGMGQIHGRGDIIVILCAPGAGPEVCSVSHVPRLRRPSEPSSRTGARVLCTPLNVACCMYEKRERCVLVFGGGDRVN